MQPYSERAAEVASGSQIAVLILANNDFSDLEFVPLRPRMADESTWADLKARWPGRGLQARGVVGLCGSRTACAFKEPLADAIVASLANSFAEYVRVLLGEDLAGWMEAVEMRREAGDFVDWANSLWLLPDGRD